MQKRDISPKIYVIILNYNGWADTIECLESVLRNDYPNYQVIVVDNNSPNNSMEYIKAWAEGRLDVWVKPDHSLRHLSFPPVKKPIPYVCYTREEAERGGNSDLEKKLRKDIPKGVTTQYPLVFIQTGKNLGFAGGNNVGIRYALAKGDFEYVWILNNDTVIQRGALQEYIKCASKNQQALWGAKLIYYHSNGIQAMGGGRLIEILGINYNLKEETNDEIDYITGASMFFHKSLIEEVGLLSEEYFLTWEDIDFSLRVKNKKFDLKVCSKAIIFHKETASISKKSFIDIYFRTRNCLLLTKKYYSKFLPFVFVFNLVKILKAAKNPNYFRATISAYKDFLRNNLNEGSISNR